MRPDIAIVELVASRPGQGVASVFKFGCGFGMVRGVIAASGVPLHLVSPSKWKRHFGLDADKEKARALALRLWPSRADLFGRKKDHGRAEAAACVIRRRAHRQRRRRPMTPRSPTDALEAEILAGAGRALRNRASSIRERAASGVVTILDRRPVVRIVMSESAHALRIAKDFDEIADSLEREAMP